jgi:hypothetical protein
MILMKSLLASILATSALAGSAGAYAQPGQSQPTTGAAQSQTSRRLDLTPLVDVEAPHRSGESSVGGYVRFYVCEVSQCNTPAQGTGGGSSDSIDRRNYDVEDGSSLGRWFVGRSYNRLLTVKLTVREPNVGSTATVASSAQQSNRQVGESWTTEVNGRRYLTPYLRVDTGTTIEVEVNLNASRQLQANVSRSILDLLGRAAALGRPEGKLVTSLNEDRFRRTAEFIDESISNLFAQNVGERGSNEFGAGDWNSSDPIVTVQAMFPMGRRVIDQRYQQAIGSWQVRATAPLVSIFSDVPLRRPPGVTVPTACTSTTGETEQQACTAFLNLTPQQVLGLQVGESTTLRQALAGDPAIMAAVGATNPAIADVCSLVAARAEDLGLNRFDTAAAVWAFSQTRNVGGVNTLVTSASTCAAGRLAKDLLPLT